MPLSQRVYSIFAFPVNNASANDNLDGDVLDQVNRWQQQKPLEAPFHGEFSAVQIAEPKPLAPTHLSSGVSEVAGTGGGSYKELIDLNKLPKGIRNAAENILSGDASPQDILKVTNHLAHEAASHGDFDKAQRLAMAARATLPQGYLEANADSRLVHRFVTDDRWTRGKAHHRLDAGGGETTKAAPLQPRPVARPSTLADNAHSRLPNIPTTSVLDRVKLSWDSIKSQLPQIQWHGAERTPFISLPLSEPATGDISCYAGVTRSMRPHSEGMNFGCRGSHFGIRATGVNLGGQPNHITNENKFLTLELEAHVLDVGNASVYVHGGLLNSNNSWNGERVVGFNAGDGSWRARPTSYRNREGWDLGVIGAEMAYHTGIKGLDVVGEVNVYNYWQSGIHAKAFYGPEIRLGLSYNFSIGHPFRPARGVKFDFSRGSASPL